MIGTADYISLTTCRTFRANSGELINWQEQVEYIAENLLSQVQLVNYFMKKNLNTKALENNFIIPISLLFVGSADSTYETKYAIPMLK
jgi:hypothetical protein